LSALHTVFTKGWAGRSQNPVILNKWFIKAIQHKDARGPNNCLVLWFS
jgi:hypothetical protein